MFYSPARRTFVVSPKFRSRLRTEDGQKEKVKQRYGEIGEGENSLVSSLIYDERGVMVDDAPLERS